MRFTSRLVLTLLMLAIPVAALRAVPLDCDPGIAAAPMDCSGSSCCCKDTGACLCPRPPAPPTPTAPPAPALTSGGIEIHAEPCATWAFATIAPTPHFDCNVPATATASTSAHQVRLCVLQV